MVFDSPGARGTHELDPARAPDAVWVSITPFGLDGPRASWRASDLGVMAASGNMFATGDPDRAPVRCTEPASYAHTARRSRVRGAERAVERQAATRRRLDAGGRARREHGQRPANFPKTGNRGRRLGASIGRTREIWPALDGFVSFGLRGGKARVASLETLTKLVVDDGIPADALTSQDWNTYNQNTATDEELDGIATAVAEYFSRHTMQELYDIACETNLMLAPANSPKEIYASAQLASRDFFGPVDDVERFPRSFVVVRSADGEAAPVRPGAASARIDTGPPPYRPRTATPRSPSPRGRRRGTACTSSSSAPARPGRSRRATSPRTARPCCASSRARGPTSCARWRWPFPTTRTASRARRCTTGSTSASATSRST